MTTTTSCPKEQSTTRRSLVLLFPKLTKNIKYSYAQKEWINKFIFMTYASEKHLLQTSILSLWHLDFYSSRPPWWNRDIWIFNGVLLALRSCYFLSQKPHHHHYSFISVFCMVLGTLKMLIRYLIHMVLSSAAWVYIHGLNTQKHHRTQAVFALSKLFSALWNNLQ